MVSEDGGVPAISSLRKSDPFKPNGCRLSDPECMVEGDRDCTKSGIIYEITCIQCSKAENETGKLIVVVDILSSKQINYSFGGYNNSVGL